MRFLVYLQQTVAVSCEYFTNSRKMDHREIVPCVRIGHFPFRGAVVTRSVAYFLQRFPEWSSGEADQHPDNGRICDVLHQHFMGSRIQLYTAKTGAIGYTYSDPFRGVYRHCAGFFRYAVLFTFPFSSSMEDLVGAGFPFLAGAIKASAGLVALLTSRK